MDVSHLEPDSELAPTQNRSYFYICLLALS
jgi:hypothetical protein